MPDAIGTNATGYHAHVYFEPATRDTAARLREALIGQFTVEPGGFSDEPRGPHPISQFNIIFQAEEFARIVPWMMFNRQGLDVLVHPLTDNMYNDHSIHALWLGTPVELKLDHLTGRPYPTELLPGASARA
jgi:aromatic ring-cleaving dioxygenase